MKGSEEQLLKFMDGSDKRFLIPVYQRNYDWKIANCRQLFDDLVRVIKEERKSHFFGSIVYAYDADGDTTNEYLIIDGQQRLTTISLLLLAMHNLIEKGVISSADPLLSEKIYKKYLVDEWAPEETRIKLKPVKNDNAAFHKLFGSEDGYYKNSNLTINYEFFYNQVQRELITVDDLFKAILRLQVICIRLNSEDNPQLIFESLNSTGLDLTEGDKIRNLVLMGQTKKKQNEFYDKYWNPIEQATNYDVSMFIRDYLSVKTQETPSINTVYDAYKKYSRENEPDVETLLKDTLKYAKFYEILIKAGSSYDEMDRKLNEEFRYSIRRLNWLETTVTRPFLLEILNLFFGGILTLADIQSILNIVENYLFRRNICDVATNALNKIFLNLNREIVRYDGSYESYVDKMKYALLSKRESGRFPDDDEFSLALSEKNIYNMRNKYRSYILERYENFGTRETKNVYKGIEDGTYSVEHIMPQHLTPAWMEAMGMDYQQIHSEWLNRIANLTLTAYNSKYSNEPFAVKKTLVDKNTGLGIGFANSGLRMNQWIAQRDRWTLDEIMDRDKHMIDMAKRIWPIAVTSYKPEEKPMESVSLDEDIDLTGRQISKFSYKGLEQPVTSWVEAYQKILSILHQSDESILTALAYNDDPDVDLSIHVMPTSEAFHSCAEIADGIFVWTGISTRYKISNLLKFFKLFNADPQDLTFYLKDETAAETARRTESGRHALRLRYWAFALPIIQEETRELGCFANVNPTVQNWITGYFGIRGFSINCVSNYDGARVEFYLSKSDTAENKRAFDMLYSHKDEIEAVLGDGISWERADSLKYSRVCAYLTGAGIDNEGDWKLMAKFEGEWSKKLCDALLPYIRELYR